jgi:hypothetical protein
VVTFHKLAKGTKRVADGATLDCVLKAGLMEAEPLLGVHQKKDLANFKGVHQRPPNRRRRINGDVARPDVQA